MESAALGHRDPTLCVGSTVLLTFLETKEAALNTLLVRKTSYNVPVISELISNAN